MRMQWQWTPDSQWMQLTPAGWWGLGGAFVVLVALVVAYVWQTRRRQRRFETRLAQLTAALALLTDTVETGFQDVMRQTARASQETEARPAPRARTNTHRRIKSAAKRGKAVEQIAAAEQLSEGEVHLMLQMSGGQPPTTSHAEMR
jgi:C4-dicarboxylate-specific signal transduction histidine kinase